MNQSQEIIGGVSENAEETNNLRTRVAKHPLLTGSVVLVGAGLAYAAARALVRSEDSIVAQDVHIETSIAIEKAPEELYAFWRDFTNLPLFMRNLQSVSVIDDTRSHWIASGPAGDSCRVGCGDL